MLYFPLVFIRKRSYNICRNAPDTEEMIYWLKKEVVGLKIMTVKEAAQKWGITPRRVQELIREGRIQGVVKFGTTQVMPDDTQKPPRKNKRKTAG